MPYDEWFLGEISVTAFPYAPPGWAMCDGRMMSVSANQALFALIGVAYGGDGTTTFALPDLRGRTPLHRAGGIAHGAKLGVEDVTLNIAQMPSHTHAPMASADRADRVDPGGATWGVTRQNAYAAEGTAIPMDPGAIAPAGGGHPHPNLPPFLGLNFIIALTGIFPTR